MVDECFGNYGWGVAEGKCEYFGMGEEGGGPGLLLCEDGEGKWVFG